MNLGVLIPPLITTVLSALIALWIDGKWRRKIVVDFRESEPLVGQHALSSALIELGAGGATLASPFITSIRFLASEDVDAGKFNRSRGIRFPISTSGWVTKAPDDVDCCIAEGYLVFGPDLLRRWQWIEATVVSSRKLSVGRPIIPLAGFKLETLKQVRERMRRRKQIIAGATAAASVLLPASALVFLSVRHTSVVFLDMWLWQAAILCLTFAPVALIAVFVPRDRLDEKRYGTSAGDS